MYYDNDFNQAISKARADLQSAFQAYKARSSSNDADNASWEASRKDIEQKLAQEFTSFEPTYVLPLWNKSLQNANGLADKDLPKQVNLGSLWHYIDFIRSAPISAKIIAYNRDYLKSCLEELAKNYVAILRYLNKQSLQRAGVNGPEWKTAVSTGKKILDELFSKTLPALAQREFDAFILDVENSVA